MVYCPQCHCEYQDIEGLCPVCRIVLVIGADLTMEGVIQPNQLLQVGVGLESVHFPVAKHLSSPCLVAVAGLLKDKIYSLGNRFSANRTILIGRFDGGGEVIDLTSQEPLDRVWVSRRHASISSNGKLYFLEDLNSSNGTYLNYARLFAGEKHPLKNGDIVQIGSVQLIFSE